MNRLSKYTAQILPKSRRKKIEILEKDEDEK